MTERDLENLKHLAVPPARTEARRAATDTALAAFDAAADDNSQFEIASQGNVASVRPIRTMNRTRSFLMGLTSRQNMAIAASLFAVVIAAPIAFKTYQTERTLSLPMQPAKPET